MFTLPLKVFLMPDTMLVEGYVKCQFHILLGSVSIKQFFPPTMPFPCQSLKARNIYFSHFSSSVSLYRRSHDSAQSLVQMNLLRGGKKKIKANTKHLYKRQKLITIMLIKNMFVWFLFLSLKRHILNLCCSSWQKSNNLNVSISVLTNEVKTLFTTCLHPEHNTEEAVVCYKWMVGSESPLLTAVVKHEVFSSLCVCGRGSGSDALHRATYKDHSRGTPHRLKDKPVFYF